MNNNNDDDDDDVPTTIDKIVERIIINFFVCDKAAKPLHFLFDVSLFKDIKDDKIVFNDTLSRNKDLLFLQNLPDSRRTDNKNLINKQRKITTTLGYIVNERRFLTEDENEEQDHEEECIYNLTQEVTDDHSFYGVASLCFMSSVLKNKNVGSLNIFAEMLVSVFSNDFIDKETNRYIQYCGYIDLLIKTFIYKNSNPVEQLTTPFILIPSLFLAFVYTLNYLKKIKTLEKEENNKNSENNVNENNNNNNNNSPKNKKKKQKREKRNKKKQQKQKPSKQSIKFEIEQLLEEENCKWISRFTAHYHANIITRMMSLAIFLIIIGNDKTEVIYRILDLIKKEDNELANILYNCKRDDVATQTLVNEFGNGSNIYSILIISLHICLKYNSIKEALKFNIRLGGDTIGRLLIINTILSAKSNSIPSEWVEKVDSNVIGFVKYFVSSHIS
eukprot:TRINITY_DN1127_c0_g1_i2.p1 TRINITY_DN1127_c0_g1~~TRINITY_DN1127_c0_g1_i2.p1  ORF type:complete len:445 (-),score=94.82 TRINITY_DN1127_c0_g1_i2:85-1419(-)